MSTPFTGGAVAAARRYDAWFERRWGRYAWRLEATTVLAAAGPLAGRQVIDVGCGTGRLTALMAARGARVVGVDTDPAMLAVAATRVVGRLVRADAALLPLPDASVDAAVTVATLEFTTDPARVLAEMARVTRSGGRLVAAVLNPASPWGWAGRVRHHAPYQQGCFLPRDRLLELGRRHGTAQVRGVLFAAERLPFLPQLGPILETAGRLAPVLGAVQVLTVERGLPR
ncbi:MAG: class I SAM-dependent methyltransferase [Actinobacteria bacterium]|nr:class I SAM-dependent methyltransferase [Actinomycetota bacterium]